MDKFTAAFTHSVNDHSQVNSYDNSIRGKTFMVIFRKWVSGFEHIKI